MKRWQSPEEVPSAVASNGTMLRSISYQKSPLLSGRGVYLRTNDALTSGAEKSQPDLVTFSIKHLEPLINQIVVFEISG